MAKCQIHTVKPENVWEKEGDYTKYVIIMKRKLDQGKISDIITLRGKFPGDVLTLEH